MHVSPHFCWIGQSFLFFKSRGGRFTVLPRTVYTYQVPGIVLCMNFGCLFSPYIQKARLQTCLGWLVSLFCGYLRDGYCSFFFPFVFKIIFLLPHPRYTWYRSSERMCSPFRLWPPFPPPPTPLWSWRRLATTLWNAPLITLSPSFFSSFLCFGGSWEGDKSLMTLCGVENLDSAQRGVISCGVHMARHPRGRCTAFMLRSLEVATPENNHITWKVSFDTQGEKLSTRCGSPASQLALTSMLLTLHATRRTPDGGSRLAQATPVWWMKTWRALSRRCRYSTATLEMSVPPLASSL